MTCQADALVQRQGIIRKPQSSCLLVRSQSGTRLATFTDKRTSKLFLQEPCGCRFSRRLSSSTPDLTPSDWSDCLIGWIIPAGWILMFSSQQGWGCWNPALNCFYPPRQKRPSRNPGEPVFYLVGQKTRLGFDIPALGSVPLRPASTKPTTSRC